MILAWLGLVVGVVGIPLTYYLTRRGRQRPDLRSAIDFDVIIKSEDGILDRLNMAFDGRKILSVSRSRVAFWNAHGDTVLGSDILPADKLRLQLDSEDIALHVRVVAMSREQIDVTCEIDPNDPTAVYISFDFIDASDGFIIELLHMKPEPARLTGTIRGAVVTSSKADLSSGAIDKAVDRWFLRLKHLNVRRAVILAVAYLVPIIIAGSFVYSLREVILGEPALVNPSTFDLTQIEGQRDFAIAVRDAGNTDRESVQSLLWAMAGYCAVLFLLPLVLTVSQLRASVPRSIVRIRPDSIADHAGGQT